VQHDNNTIYNYSKLQTRKREKSTLTMLVLNVHNFEKFTVGGMSSHQKPEANKITLCEITHSPTYIAIVIFRFDTNSTLQHKYRRLLKQK